MKNIRSRKAINGTLVNFTSAQVRDDRDAINSWDKFMALYSRGKSVCGGRPSLIETERKKREDLWFF